MNLSFFKRPFCLHALPERVVRTLRAPLIIKINLSACSNEAVSFSRSPRGRPVLDAPSVEGLECDINVSHHGHVVVLAAAAAAAAEERLPKSE